MFLFYMNGQPTCEGGIDLHARTGAGGGGGAGVVIFFSLCESHVKIARCWLYLLYLDC